MSVFYPFMSIFFCILQPDILKRLCHMNLLMDPFLCEAFNFGSGLDTVLTSRGGDLILICCSCYTYLSLLQPVTRQWKEKQQTIELASLSLCSCLLSANPFHCSTTNWLLVVLLSLPAWALLVITRGWYQVKFKYLHFLHLKNTLWGILKEKFVQSLFGHTSILGHRAAAGSRRIPDVGIHPDARSAAGSSSQFPTERVWASCSHPLSSQALQGQSRKTLTDSHHSLLRENLELNTVVTWSLSSRA